MRLPAVTFLFVALTSVPAPGRAVDQVEAETLTRESSVQPPSSWRVSFSRLMKEGRFAAASRVLAKHAGDEERGVLEHRLGVARARQGEIHEGLQALERAASLRPHDPDIAFDRVVTMSWGRLHWEAVEAFEALPHPDAAPPYVRREAAEAYRGIYRFTEAMRLYTSLLEDPAEDADTLEAIRSLLLENGARFLDPVVNRLARKGAVPPGWLATHAWTTPGIEAALRAAVRGESSVARRALREALATAPLQRDAIADWLVLMHLGGRFEEAVLLWPAVPQRLSSPLLPRVVDALNALGQSEMALALARSVCEVHPTSPAACAGVARSLLRLERQVEAAAVAGRLEGPGARRVTADVELFAGRVKAARALYAETDAPESRLGLALAQAMLGRGEEAKPLLTQALEALSLDDHLLQHPLTPAASMALARTLIDVGRPGDALLVLVPMIAAQPGAIDPLLLQARAYESLGRRVEAAHTYQQVLTLDPSREAVARARVQVLAQLLALTPARAELARPGNADLEETVQELDVVRAWTMQGMKQAAPDGSSRSIERRARQVLAVLRTSRDTGLPVGETLLRAGAEAALELDDNELALELYGALHEVLANRDQGDSDDAVDVRLSQVRCLMRLLRFAEAERMLDALDAAVPVRRPDSNQPSWGKAAIATERGWLLIAQDRLAEARAHFLHLQAQAPGSAATLSGLAHTNLMLGWKRQALDAFELGTGLHPDDIGLRVGLSEALRSNGQANRAARLAAELSKELPADREVRDLVRQLALDQRPRLISSGMADTQARDQGGLWGELSLEVPVRPDLTVTGGYGWRRETAGPGNEATRHRASVGARFAWNRDLALAASGSADPFTGRWGLAAEASFEPSDRSWLSLRANTDAWSLPPGALRAGASGHELFASGGHAVDESLGLFAELGVLSMSDGTRLPTAILEARRRLLARSGWRLSFALESGAATSSKEQELYYAPTWLWTTAQPSLEHTWTASRAYRLEDRLSVQAGVDLVAGFGASERLGLFYEQSHTFGDRGELVVQTGVTRQSFDGVPEVGWQLGLTGLLQF